MEGPTASTVPYIDLDLAEPLVKLTELDGGALLYESGHPLGPYPRQLGDVLRERAAEHPKRVFMAERSGRGWRRVTYGEARRLADAVSQALIGRGHGPDRPVAMLSDNSINGAMLKLGAMQAGIPFMPISPGFALLSRTFEKLRYVAGLARPSLIYVEKVKPFERALAALDLDGVEIVTGEKAARKPATATIRDFFDTPPGAEAEAAFARIDGDTVAKILFTSGSTGNPKGVPNTQRMMCSNGVALDTAWPFLKNRPPVLVDWLPWSHTFGANHNFNLILRNGGTMYIDRGRPAPGLFEESVKSLRAVRPTLLHNVARYYDLLLPYLEDDDDFARHVFGDLDLIFYAGVALPELIRHRLDAVAVKARGRRIPIVSGLGATETGPSVLLDYQPNDEPHGIGIPLPGVQCKLVPEGGKMEILARGPNIMPGYLNQPELTRQVIDDEGYFHMGDAVRFVDRARPELGLVFDGRVAENFKLLTGTWVHVGDLRLAAIRDCAPYFQDAVVAGEGTEHVGLLVFPDLPACRGAIGAGDDVPAADLVADPKLLKLIADKLAAYNAKNPGSSRRVARALLLAEPPVADANEITDKGHVNQRAVLARRAAEVDRLFAEAPGDGVIVCG